jgi:hypothetical protein
MPPKTSSALSSTTPFFSPLGILNSPPNLSKLRGSLHTVSNRSMPGGGSKFKVQELKDRKMGNFHVLGLEMSKNDLWSAKCAAIGLPDVLASLFSAKSRAPGS